MLLSDNARTVLERRYLAKANDGSMETPEDMLRRVAKNIAQQEEDPIWEQRFFEVMDNLEFLPNSPTLMNAGRNLQQLSACFVLPVEDSMEGIFDTLRNTALIQKSGGGTGFSFSRLRPNADMVSTTGGVASGPISFMKCYNAATDAIKQGGTRRGANMGILRVDHPDIIQFIQCKADLNEITNFNLSVAITEEFMEAVLADEPYNLINPRSQEVAGQLKAREVFELIVEMAWKNGEPGIVFLDRMNRFNPTPQAGEIEATNPCGEQPLLPNESCNLGSINLAKMAKKSKGKWDVNWERLQEVVEIGVRFLDNVIDVNRYPIPAIEEMTIANRKIGLGVMGFSDLLMRLGVAYNSKEGVDLGREIMKFIQTKGHEASSKLGAERGSFPNYIGSIFEKSGKPMRNATVTTIAPTGTISIIAGCSSGIEPIFALAFTRNVMDDDKLIEVNAQFEEILKDKGLYTPELIEAVAQTGNASEIEAIPENLRKVFVTAYETTPEWHIRMQAAFQEYTDNAVSKTVNFPKEATKEDIRDVYQLAYDLGCKGATVYRAGSREGEVLTVGHKAAEAQEEAPEVKSRPTPRRRPQVTTGQTVRIKTGCGSLYVTINADDEGICEVFTTIGKAGGCAGSFSEATARLISTSLRAGVEPKQLVKQLKGIRCPHPIWQNGRQVLSCPDAIALVLDQYLDNNGVEETEMSLRTSTKSTSSSIFTGDICPDCSGNMVEESGCSTCLECGFSRCS